MSEDELRQKLFVTEEMLKAKQDECRALKASMEEMQRQRDWWRRIVNWYRSRRADNTDMDTWGNA